MKTLLCLSLLVLFFASCAHVTKTAKKEEPPPAAPRSVNIPSPVAPQMEKRTKIEMEGSGELFTFSLREADVKDVLRAIATQSHYNIVVEPAAKGICTVDIKNVALEKALEYIVEPLGLSYKIEGNTVYVSRPKLETKMFPINYLALKKIGYSTVFGNTGGTIAGGGAAPPGMMSPTGTTPAPGTSLSGSSGSTITLRSDTESDIWKSLEDNIKVLISKKGPAEEEEGAVFVNRQANMVVVTDYPRKLKSIAKFLESIEAIVHRQVLIEARIVEVQLNQSYQEGINWQLLNAKIAGYTSNVGQQLTAPVVLPTSSSTGATATTPPFFALFVGSGRPGSGLDINNTFIELVQTQGTVHVVSSPKIVTMNNQRAVIKVATQDVYFDVQMSASTAVGGTNVVTYTPKFIMEGLLLDVIPQIDDVGNIILNIHPMVTTKISEVTQPINTGTGPTTFTYVPVLDVREADTMVKMRDGDTVIIGGLMQDYKNPTKSGVPGLMSIPLLGKLFSYTQETKTKIELVILLTPRIVHNGDGK